MGSEETRITSKYPSGIIMAFLLILACVVETHTFTGPSMNLLVGNRTKTTAILKEAFSIDPCYDYTIMDDPWRATTQKDFYSLFWYYDYEGWYRFCFYGQSTKMPDTCVEEQSCGTEVSLRLNGQHPRMEDGVVTRGVCGDWNTNCCYYNSTPIKVKACPGNYYVYELKSPFFSHYSESAYCAEALPIDPCYNYTVLDDPWRATDNTNFIQLKNDYANWFGWYRLLLYGRDAQITDTCVEKRSCGTRIHLRLDGQHPKIEDGHWFYAEAVYVCHRGALSQCQ